jgi:hypothetical protein
MTRTRTAKSTEDHGEQAILSTCIPELLGRNIKGNVSIALYALGIAFAFVELLLAFGAYALVAIMWFIPDRRFANSGDKPA